MEISKSSLTFCDPGTLSLPKARGSHVKMGPSACRLHSTDHRGRLREGHKYRAHCGRYCPPPLLVPQLSIQQLLAGLLLTLCRAGWGFSRPGAQGPMGIGTSWGEERWWVGFQDRGPESSSVPRQSSPRSTSRSTLPWRLERA